MMISVMSGSICRQRTVVCCVSSPLVFHSSHISLVNIFCFGTHKCTLTDACFFVCQPAGLRRWKAAAEGAGAALCGLGEGTPHSAAGLPHRDERGQPQQPHELHRQPAGMFPHRAWTGSAFQMTSPAYIKAVPAEPLVQRALTSRKTCQSRDMFWFSHPFFFSYNFTFPVLSLGAFHQCWTQGVFQGFAIIDIGTCDSCMSLCSGNTDCRSQMGAHV